MLLHVLSNGTHHGAGEGSHLLPGNQWWLEGLAQGGPGRYQEDGQRQEDGRHLTTQAATLQYCSAVLCAGYLSLDQLGSTFYDLPLGWLLHCFMNRSRTSVWSVLLGTVLWTDSSQSDAIWPSFYTMFKPVSWTAFRASGPFLLA